MVPTLVITEVVHLLATRLGPEPEVAFSATSPAGPSSSSRWLPGASNVSS